MDGSSDELYKNRAFPYANMTCVDLRSFQPHIVRRMKISIVFVEPKWTYGQNLATINSRKVFLLNLLIYITHKCLIIRLCACEALSSVRFNFFSQNSHIISFFWGCVYFRTHEKSSWICGMRVYRWLFNCIKL